VVSKLSCADPDAQVITTVLAQQGRVHLQPRFCRLPQLLSAEADVAIGGAHATQAPSATSTEASSATSTLTTDRISVPWILLSGGVNWTTLHLLLWQVQTTLARQPGMPERHLSDVLQHFLGPVHLRLLLERMEANGLLNCVQIPEHMAAWGGSGSVQAGREAGSAAGPPERLGRRTAEDLCHVDGGLVPALFAVSTGAEVVPVVTHYFVHPAASVSLCSADGCNWSV
jgi:hypothetical protein